MTEQEVWIQTNWFVEQMNATKCKDADRKLSLTRKGYTYFKIIGYNSGVWGFIDRSNGDILLPKNWSSPAKHARGNVFDTDILSKVDWTGPRYLK